MEGSLLRRAAHASRRVTVGLIARAFPGKSLSEVEAQIASRSVPEQAGIIGAVLAVLLAAFAIAMQFGIVGLAVFFVAVIALVG